MNHIEAVRRENNRTDKSFSYDVEAILDLPYFNRCRDKTQVFSFFHNEAITKRGLHIQYVSYIARRIGEKLGFNLDLIEAIALGHDIGHPPFGHDGEVFLNDLFFSETKRHFKHNVHSVRILDKICKKEIALQVLDGILNHNFLIPDNSIRCRDNKSFVELDYEIETGYSLDEITWKEKHFIPATLEACLVRICDMIAYLMKDREDAVALNVLDSKVFSSSTINNNNFINMCIKDIVDKSKRENGLAMSEGLLEKLQEMKKENIKYIYKNTPGRKQYWDVIQPMYREIYYRSLEALMKNDSSARIYGSHILKIEVFYNKQYREEDKNQIVVDFIAGLTERGFIALYNELCSNKKYMIHYQDFEI